MLITESAVLTGDVPLDAESAEQEMRSIQSDLGRQYQVQSYINRGAFATVWQGYDRVLDCPIAIKKLTQQSRGRRDFYRELRALFRLQHPHVVQILNLIDTTRGQYLILEYCGGGSLRRSLSLANRANVFCSPERAAVLCNQMVQALAAAHRLGIVHRDLKPENMLFVQEHSGFYGGTSPIKIADFGLAQSQPREDLYAINPAGLTGSPAYMAPEQFTDQFSSASDIYSLGVILYELLHGKRPFEGDPASLAQQHLYDDPSFGEHLPAIWIDFLRALLAKNPSDRPAISEIPTRWPNLFQQQAPVVTKESRPIPTVVSHALGVRCDRLQPLCLTSKGPNVMAFAAEGIFLYRTRSSGLAGYIPLAEVQHAFADGNRIWLFRSNQIWSCAGDFKPVLAHRLPIIPDQILPIPNDQFLIRSGSDLAAIALSSNLSVLWNIKLPRTEPNAPLVVLPDGRIVSITGRSQFSLILLSNHGQLLSQIPLPGRCVQLGFWPKAHGCYALLQCSEGTNLHYVDTNTQKIHCLSQSNYLFAGTDSSHPDALLAIQSNGTIERWDHPEQSAPLPEPITLNNPSAITICHKLAWLEQTEIGSKLYLRELS